MPTIVELQPMPTPYDVDDGSVVLTVIVGEGQSGLSRVTLDGEELEMAEEITDLEVGDGPEIQGKTLKVTTSVTAMNPNSRRTVVTYRLNGGAADRTFVSNGPDTALNHTIDFVARFRLR